MRSNPQRAQQLIKRALQGRGTVTAPRPAAFVRTLGLDMPEADFTAASKALVKAKQVRTWRTGDGMLSMKLAS